jgi:hypothetical protein
MSVYINRLEPARSVHGNSRVVIPGHARMQSRGLRMLGLKIGGELCVGHFTLITTLPGFWMCSLVSQRDPDLERTSETPLNV